MTQVISDSEAETALSAPILAALAGKAAINREDVTTLRRSAVSATLMSRADAEAMFAIERHASRKCREWGDFLIEAVLDYAVWSERPTGIVTNETAAWLMAQVGPAPTPACLALLVAVMEEAIAVPPGFAQAVRDRARRVFAGAGTPFSAAA